jgi:hypothetical protein
VLTPVCQAASLVANIRGSECTCVHSVPNPDGEPSVMLVFTGMREDTRHRRGAWYAPSDGRMQCDPTTAEDDVFSHNCEELIPVVSLLSTFSMRSIVSIGISF